HAALLFALTPTATTSVYTLSLHDALPISGEEVAERFGALHGVGRVFMPTVGEGHSHGLAERLGALLCCDVRVRVRRARVRTNGRSEEHTSELQSRENLVCRLLLEKKKQK